MGFSQSCSDLVQRRGVVLGACLTVGEVKYHRTKARWDDKKTFIRSLVISLGGVSGGGGVCHVHAPSPSWCPAHAESSVVTVSSIVAAGSVRGTGRRAPGRFAPPQGSPCLGVQCPRRRSRQPQDTTPEPPSGERAERLAGEAYQKP